MYIQTYGEYRYARSFAGTRFGIDKDKILAVFKRADFIFIAFDLPRYRDTYISLQNSGF